MTMHQPPVIRLPRMSVIGDSSSAGERTVPEETPIALTYNGSTHAVMMGSPSDLEDFALGFSLSEGVISDPADLESIEVVEHENGCEIRMRLFDRCAQTYQVRRRALAGPVGCGLCGVESLSEATRPVRSIACDFTLPAEAISAAMMDLSLAQRLNREARAVHAAAFWRPENGIIAIREDVGRHNALDKLAGALAGAFETCNDGIVLLTSRVSVEMVQKTARMGSPILVAISAPTALAVRIAESCGITLVAIARGDSFEVFTHPGRLLMRPSL